MSFSRALPSSLFELQFPQWVGIYNTYADAQQAVDFLADEKFEVQNLAIVGTELKSVERVLGRRNWGTVITSGVQSGLSDRPARRLGRASLHQPPRSFLPLLIGALAIGIFSAVGFAAVGYACPAVAATSRRSARPSPPSTRCSASTRSPRRPGRCCRGCPAPAPPRSSDVSCS